MSFNSPISEMKQQNSPLPSALSLEAFPLQALPGPKQPSRLWGCREATLSEGQGVSSSTRQEAKSLLKCYNNFKSNKKVIPQAI